MHKQFQSIDILFVRRLNWNYFKRKTLYSEILYVGETGKTLKTRMKQHKAAIRNRYMPYLTTVHSLDPGHQFAFDEAQIIGQAQTKAGRLFMEAIYSDENSINRPITLDPCYALIKDRLTR